MLVPLRGTPTYCVTGGANSKNICFGRTAKFIRESEDIAGNREPREIIRGTANNIRILHNIFGACSLTLF